MYESIRNNFEYIPLALLTFLFISDIEIDGKLTNHMCNIFLTFFILIFVYICLVDYKMNRYIVLALATLLWLVLIFGKRCVM